MIARLILLGLRHAQWWLVGCWQELREGLEGGRQAPRQLFQLATQEERNGTSVGDGSSRDASNLLSCLPLCLGSTLSSSLKKYHVGKNHDDDGEKKRFFAMVGTICCLLLLAALLAGIYAGTNILTSDEEDNGVTEDRKQTYSSGPGSSKPGDGSSTTQATSEMPTAHPTHPSRAQPPPATIRPTPTASSSNATISVTGATTDSMSTTKVATDSTPYTTLSATASPQTTVSAQTTTPKRPGLRRFTTVCTVSYLHIGLVMPPGDNCNYIFYDSLYSRPEDTFMGTFTNNYLKPFFDAARQSTTVRFGFSVHAPAVDGFTNEIRSVDGKKHYKDHWQQNVYGWGFLNIHELIIKNSPQVVKSALTALKVWCLNL
ncbi:uncharacterized protein LOC144110893 [Amblyomma americanum]